MRRLVLPLLVSGLLAGGFAAAHGARAPDAEALAAARAQARQALARSRQFEAEANRAENEAARARAESKALAANIEAAEAKLTAAEAQIALIGRMRAEQRARLAERQGPAIRLAAALQTMTRRPPALALVQPGSVEDAVHVRSLLAATLPEIRRRTASLRAELRRSEELRARAQQARQALAASREELHSRRIALARFEARQRMRSENLTGLALAESDRALALGEEARALARLVGTREYQARLEASLSELPGPIPRPGSRPERPGPGPGGLRYMLPVEGRVVKGVGEISDAGVHARGLTLAPSAGARVLAPADGRVLFAGPFRSYGQILILDHGQGWSSVITGLSAIDVASGDTLRRGRIVGQADRADPRVSVELRRNGEPMPVAQLIAG